MAKNNQKKNLPIETELKINANDINFNTKYLWVILVVVFGMFCFSIFKNIQYPLFWADESMTAVGAQRVLEFGYPKVHDGKNVFYDLRHTNPTLGIDKETDAYVGGTGWGHYYFGAIAVKLANAFDDIYTKTGIIRSVFAIAGISGLVIFVWLSSSVFQRKETRLIFAIGFFFLTLFSVSLALHLREARYYSISILLFSIITGCYIKFRFGDGINLWVLRIVLILSLVFMFFTFAPVYFILLLILGAFECILLIKKYIETKKLKELLLFTEPISVSLILSLLIVYPFLGYFKTFEISDAMAVYNNYNTKMYWDNVSTIYKYFRGFELFYLAVAFKILILINFKATKNVNVLFISLFTFLAFIIYVYIVARVPNFIYTRYIIVLVPLLISSILLDFVALVVDYQSNKIQLSGKFYLYITVTLIFVSGTVIANSKDLKGHISELFNPYKGPLDYTIPAIKQKFVKTDTLIIAANYEETSYMYYLGAKVVVGFIGNNLEEDSKANPHVIAYRKPWGNFGEVFQGYFSKNQYGSETYPNYDNPVNNIPELNFMPAFNHQFKTKMAQNPQEATELYFIK